MATVIYGDGKLMDWNKESMKPCLEDFKWDKSKWIILGAFCPICEYSIDGNGECVNANCPTHK